jgi:hypothetical protein
MGNLYPKTPFASIANVPAALRTRPILMPFLVPAHITDGDFDNLCGLQFTHPFGVNPGFRTGRRSKSPVTIGGGILKTVPLAYASWDAKRLPVTGLQDFPSVAPQMGHHSESRLWTRCVTSSRSIFSLSCLILHSLLSKNSIKWFWRLYALNNPSRFRVRLVRHICNLESSPCTRSLA